MIKKLIASIVVLTALLIMVIGLAGTPIFPNCEFCGEQFDARSSKLEQMCDICFGWNEHKAITDNGVQVTFSDGTGYYFEGGRK